MVRRQRWLESGGSLPRCGGSHLSFACPATSSWPWPPFPRTRVELRFLRFRRAAVRSQTQGQSVPPGDCYWFFHEIGCQDDGQMCPAMEVHCDFFVGHFDIGWHINQVAEDLTGLCVSVTPHSLSDQPVEAAGQDRSEE